MDPRAFDELSKRLAEKTSRGRALKLFGGALVGTFVGAGTAKAHPPQKHCKYARYSCQRNIDCCSNNCCNRICCDDGMTCCGGECLRCPAGQTVDPNTCECVGGSPPPPPGTCGNGICDAGETCSTCPQDCGDCPPGCGDGNCDETIGENCATCPDDCGPCGGCGDGFCDETIGENCANCPDDCGPCGGCGDGFCDTAAGENMNNCPDCTVPVCGNDACEPGEDPFNCASDCAIPTCGNGLCEPGTGEDVNTCPGDCPQGVCPPGGDFCVGTAGRCSSTNSNCVCFMTVEGNTTCVDLSAIDFTNTCSLSLDCPSGVCVSLAGCGVPTPVCAPPCTS